MTTWVIKSEIDDPKHALKIAEVWRNAGQQVWIEDESGNRVDEETLEGIATRPTAHRLGKFGMGVLFWLVPLAVGMGILYLMGLWVDGT